MAVPRRDLITQPPLLSFGLGPHRHETRDAAGQFPIRPPLIFQGESAPEFDRVDLKPLEDVLIHNGQLLNRIVDANRPLFQAKELTQARVGDGRDARRTVSGKVDWDAIRLEVAQSRQYPLPRIH